MDKRDDEHLLDFVEDIDTVIAKYSSVYPAHSITGVLLARITHLMADDPATAKHLLKFVWEKFDEIEQSNPGQYL